MKIGVALSQGRAPRTGRATGSRRILRSLASLRLTLLGIAALMVIAFVVNRFEGVSSAWLTVVLACLALNLVCAILDRPQFRRQPALLVFHLSLLAILVLSALGLMVRMQGRVEVVEGQAFDASRVETVAVGPWHRRRLERIGFEQGRIEVAYNPDLVRGRTRSEVRTWAGQSSTLSSVGDTRPLVLEGYRFLTTSNKGYAVLLTWESPDAMRLTGAVHMPSYPLYEWKQRNHWIAPSGERLEIELVLPAVERERPWTLRTVAQDAALDVSVPNVGARVLRVGDELPLKAGTLRFDGVRLWMGYRIEFNPVLPWLFAASVVGVSGLAWHFWRKLGLQPADARSDGAARGVKRVHADDH